MNPLSRTRDQLILGAWAFAPVLAVVTLFLTWPGGVNDGSSQFAPYDPAYSTPLSPWRLLQLFGTIALVLVAAALILGDVWRRPVPGALRKAWTVFVLLGAPFGGLAYWLLHCHGSAQTSDATELA
jgi:hypothetical protein